MKLLKAKKAKQTKRYICFLFWLNVLVSSVQYFILGYKNDFVGGIFGTNLGCNGITNIFCCVITIWLLVDYLYKKISIVKLGLYLLACLYLIALAEIKFFFVEVVIIVAVSLLITKRSNRKLVLTGCTMLVLVVGYQLLAIYYPYFTDFLTLDNIMTYLRTGALRNHIAVEYIHGMTRMTALPKIHEMFFKDSPIISLLGLGLGNADTSSIAIFASEFYKKFSYLNYQNYYYSMVYIETGFIGLLVFASQFILFMRLGLSHLKDMCAEIQIESICLILMGIIGLLSFWYDASLRTSTAGYIYYFAIGSSIAAIHERKSAVAFDEE